MTSREQTTRTAAQQKDTGSTLQPAASKRTSPHPLYQFQQARGNRAFGRFIQAKLRVSQPGDAFEQEADRVADQVTRMPHPVTDQTAVSRLVSPTRLQRACSKCEEEKTLSSEDVGKDEERHLQASSIAGNLNMTPSAEAGLREGGEPLSAATRSYFEPRFGHDFADVRVHANTPAGAVARSVNALAFTIGRDVVFGPGQYAPASLAGRKLIAHELTHVVQQGKAERPADAPLQVHRSEHKAERAPGSVTRNDRVRIITAGGPRVARLASLPPAPDGSVLSDAELASEIGLMQQWLQDHPASSEDRNNFANTLAALTREAIRRQPQVTEAPPSRAAPVAAAPVAAPMMAGVVSPGLPGPGPIGPQPPWVTGPPPAAGAAAEALEAAEVLEAAPEILEAAPEVLEAAPAVAEGVGVGLGAIAAGALAFLAVTLWPSNSIVSGDEERRMLEEAKRQQTQTQPQATPQTQTQEQTREKQPETCATKYPTIPNCASLHSGYTYRSPQAALNFLKTRLGNPSLSLRSPATTTEPPCAGIGMHYGVRSGRDYVASIVCCPCCMDTPAGPVTTNRCRIV